MMKKGILYLLPFFALTQIGATNAVTQVDKVSFATYKAPMTGVVAVSRSKDSLQVMKTLKRPISGRNRMVRQNAVADVPRAGRNVRRVAHGKKLLKRR